MHWVAGCWCDGDLGVRAVWRSVGDALLDDVIDHKLTSQNRCYINTIPGPEPTFDISHRMGCGWVLGPRYGKGVVMMAVHATLRSSHRTSSFQHRRRPRDFMYIDRSPVAMEAERETYLQGLLQRVEALHQKRIYERRGLPERSK